VLIVIALAVLAGGVLLFRAGVKIIGALIGVVGFALLAVVIMLAVLGQAYRIPSESMTPTVDIGDRVVAIDAGSPGIGDIVILNPPAGADQDRCGEKPPAGQMCAKPTRGKASVKFIKRVVARGGDRMALRNGLVVRNGKRVSEPYARSCRDTGCEFPREMTVPRGHVLVLGDNRGSSDDSRFWGPIPEDWVLGRVIGRYWPLKRFGKL
jgi:signal peptidase I